jgi:hypothetical protein
MSAVSEYHANVVVFATPSVPDSERVFWRDHLTVVSFGSRDPLIVMINSAFTQLAE